MTKGGLELSKLVGVTEQTSELLGFVVLYGVPQTLVDATSFSEACNALGIPAPRAIEGVDAFKRATQRVKANRIPVEGQDGQYYNLLVREVPSTESKTFRELVREVVDGDGKRADQSALSHRPIVKWSYSRTQNSLTANILEGDTLTPDLLMLAQQAINTVAIAFETEVNCYSGNVVRDTVRTFIETASAIPIKENGGAAYFVPRMTLKKDRRGNVFTDEGGNTQQVESGRVVVEALNRLVIRLNDMKFKLDWWDLPVVDGDANRGKVLNAVEERLRLQSITLMEKIGVEQKKLQKRREETANDGLEIPPSVVKRFQEEMAEIRRIRKDMEALLDKTIDSIQGAVELAEEKVQSVMW